MAPAAATLDRVQIAVAALLLVGSCAALPLAYARAWHFWSHGRSAGAVVVAATLIGALLRWAIAPLHLAMIFVGYRVTASAIELVPLMRYGAGAPTFYHALFTFLPADHHTLMGINSVVGVLAFPLIATVAAVQLDDRRAGALTALLAALVPLFIRNDNSESMNVPMIWWLFGGLVLWQEHRARGGRAALVGALVLLTLAAITRPEMPLFVPAAALLLARGAHPLERAARWGLVAAALLVLPHVAHVLLATREFKLWVIALVPFSSLYNVLFMPLLFPIALTAPALASPWLLPRERRPAVRALLVLLAVGLVLSAVDTSWSNMARVHAPVALLAVMLAAAVLVDRWPRWSRRARSLAIITLLVSALPSALSLWRPDNEQTEEKWLRDVSNMLPRQPLILVHPTREDLDPRAPPDALLTGDYYPDYWFERRDPPARVSSIARWLSAPDRTLPAYLFLGMRCYAAARAFGAPRPDGDDEHVGCARARRELHLEPLREEWVPNYGDVWMDLYGRAPRLRVGLYRILP